MLFSNAEQAGLLTYFDALVSTDANHTYKPDPRAYRLGMDRLHLAKQDILFAAFGGWDAAGAKSFGYPTYWVNRFSQPLEELGVRPDGSSTNLDGLLSFVLANQSASGASAMKEAALIVIGGRPLPHRHRRLRASSDLERTRSFEDSPCSTWPAEAQ